ncbi:MAG TPA: phosphopantetheine-binding protein [Polyangiales bacterium]|nr:phosphopantetheine-binding protein [Polyangiales bacterium]
MRETILSALAEIAPEADLQSLDPMADMRLELDLDSMDILRLATALHDKLSVEIPEGDYAKIASLQGCIDYLQKRAMS